MQTRPIGDSKKYQKRMKSYQMVCEIFSCLHHKLYNNCTYVKVFSWIVKTDVVMGPQKYMLFCCWVETKRKVYDARGSSHHTHRYQSKNGVNGHRHFSFKGFFGETPFHRFFGRWQIPAGLIASTFNSNEYYHGVLNKVFAFWWYSTFPY